MLLPLLCVITLWCWSARLPDTLACVNATCVCVCVCVCAHSALKRQKLGPFPETEPELQREVKRLEEVYAKKFKCSKVLIA